ncbi:MAG: apolipoprotein N-acyltransferase [Alphaproteobacteria bacterium]|nr:apolipoprotein N-acyltransferase [Alphaproteobacteria bacterium]
MILKFMSANKKLRTHPKSRCDEVSSAVLLSIGAQRIKTYVSTEAQKNSARHPLADRDLGRVLVALLAGAFANLAFAPFYFFPAALISFSIFYFLLGLARKKKEIFWLGFSFGFGHFLAGIYWIAESLLVDAAQFGWLIPFALTIIPSILALYVALFALTYKYFSIHKKAYQKILIFALCWLAFEVLRSNLFSGFPWNLLGYIWLFDPHFAQLGSVFGIYGLSFFAALISLSPVLVLRKKSLRSDKIFLVSLLCFLLANLVFGFLYIDDKKIITDHQTKLRLVQANIKQNLKWDEREKYEHFLQHIKLTNSKDLSDVKAVIWSETSVPYVIDDNPMLMHHLKQAVPPHGLLITGGLRLEEKKVWNSIFVLNQNGVTQYYDKHHLVPFGEYVPFHRFLSFLFLDKVVDDITGGGEGFSEGEGAQSLVTEDFSFSPLVCYEVIFSREVVDNKHLPDLLINLTNDAWFGNSSGPHQHFDMARMRTIEYGIPLVRVANTGITALVDPFGRIIRKINLNQSEVVDVSLIKNSSTTVYATYGYAPLVLLLIALASLLTFVSPQNGNSQSHTNRQAHR